MIDIHLWFHTILILSSSVPNAPTMDAVGPGAMRESADVIREVVAACELLEPSPDLDLPLICQPLYSAAMVYLNGGSFPSFPL